MGRFASGLVVAVLIVSCGADESVQTTTSTMSRVQSTSSTVAETPPSTVSHSTVTTAQETTTTATTLARPVTDDPYLPAAISRAEVPWSEVGFGWYVVLFDASKADPISPNDVREGPVVLYLVDATGRRYEVVAWPAGDRPYALADATAQGALVVGNGAAPDETEWQYVDLIDGTVSTVHVSESPYFTFSGGLTASLTRPSGANTVIYGSDGVDEWLERRAPDGSLLATVFIQEHVADQWPLAWIYGYDGTNLVVSHRGGISVIGNDGSLIGPIWAPSDHRCEPVRWWDPDTFLARCYGLGPASAPLDEYGNPHTYYGRLWLLEFDGTAGEPLTDYPAEPVMVGDYGYADAWPAGPDTVLQWTGDCGAAQIARLQPDGSGDFIPISVPSSILADGVAMVDVNVVAGLITIYGWQGCSGDVGALFMTDLAGNFVRELVSVVGDARSVIGAIGLAEVYP